MSSTGTVLPLAEATKIAEGICASFDGETIIAGSVRRQKPEVGDIEIMVHKDATDNLSVSPGPLIPGEYKTVRGGSRETWGYWQLQHIELGYIVDLYRFEDDNRGPLLLIRTGPAGFSKMFVTSLMRYDLKCHGSFIRNSAGTILPCPTEEDAFSFARLEYQEPQDRKGPPI